MESFLQVWLEIFCKILSVTSQSATTVHANSELVYEEVYTGEVVEVDVMVPMRNTTMINLLDVSYLYYNKDTCVVWAVRMS